MKKIITRFCAVLLSASMIFMTGCMEGVTSDSQIDKGTSQAQEIKKVKLLYQNRLNLQRKNPIMI